MTFNQADDDRFSYSDSKATLYNYVWFGLKFYYMEYTVNLSRFNYKFFSVVFFPGILNIILNIFNTLFCHKDIKIQNAITMMIVSSVYMTINYEIIPENRYFGNFERLIILGFLTIFVSNVLGFLE